MMEDPGVLAAIAFFAAVCLFFAEVFVPSGGVLGLMSAGCMVWGVMCLFAIDPVFGWVGVFVSLLSLPLALWIALKVFPHTPIGRWLTIGAVDEERVENQSAFGGETCDDLMGKQGAVVTALRPVGIVEFGGGRRVECLAEAGVVIEAGAQVRVIGVEGMAVKVGVVVG